MAVQQKQAGFSALELVLMLVVVCLLGCIGYFVYQSQHTSKPVSNAAAKTTKSSSTKVASITTFAECKQAAGSTLTETYPEQCVTKAGKTFIDTSAPAVQPPVTKAAADSPTPASGTCETTKGSVVTVSLTQGTPDPRCSQVTASQTLAVNNPTTQTVKATLGGQSVTIPAGQTGTITLPFGDYLQTGDHVIKTTLYGGSGPEIYLPAN